MIIFFASVLEIASMYGILEILDKENKMPYRMLTLYLIIAGMVATILDYAEVPYHFIFMMAVYIILLKLLIRRTTIPLMVDVVISSGCYLLLQLLASILIGVFYGNILDNNYLLFTFLLLFAALIWFAKMNTRSVNRVQLIYRNNRDIIFWIAINLFFTVMIVLHIWSDMESLFWKEQWVLLALVIVNYALNISLLLSFLNRKRQKSRMQAYQEYGEYLEEMMHQLSGRQHEFANQINVMMGFAQTKRKEELAKSILEYGERILDEKKRESPSIICDESMMAAMLYRKKAQAEKAQIQFEYQIDYPFPEYPVSVYDLVELTVNLINNAFEAVSELPAEDRQVCLRMAGKSIEVINTVSEDFNDASIIKFSEIGYSTKGRHRGYGVSNIKAIVNRYYGQMDIYVQDNMIVFYIQFQ